MKLYHAHILETDEHLCVAAQSTDHAAAVLVSFWFARTSMAPTEFSIGPGAPPGYNGNSLVQNIAAGDVAGVIVRDLKSGILFEAAIG